MIYLYLDESGDLGFDFVNKKPSKYFTVTILAISGIDNNRCLLKEVKNTIRRKLVPKDRKDNTVKELKGTGTTFEIKKYFYNRIKEINFSLYSISLNKKRVYQQLVENKSRIYNFVARNVLDKIPLNDKDDRIEMIIDKSKSKPEIEDFNSYIRGQLESRLDPKVPLEIRHLKSHENGGLQTVDLFCWGIFQKYERRKTEWYNLFRKKIKYETVYLPQK